MKLSILIVGTASLISLAMVGYALHKTNQLPDILPQPPVYQVSTTHYGPLVKTMPITVSYNDESDLALASLTKEELKSVKTHNRVILYDQENKVLPFAGKVSFIRPHREGADIVIALPKKTNTTLLRKELEIITFKFVAAARLPLSVLQKDSNNQGYVWIAQKTDNDENLFNVRRQYVDTNMKNEDLVGVNPQKVKTKDLVIFNPDNTLQSDQKIRIEEIDFRATLHDPITQAWKDVDIARLKATRATIKQRIEDCRRMAEDPDYIPEEPLQGSQSYEPGADSSCGSPLNIPPTLEIFEDIDSATP